MSDSLQNNTKPLLSIAKLEGEIVEGLEKVKARIDDKSLVLLNTTISNLRLWQAK